MRKFWIWFLVAVLLILHQDNWFWTDGTLVFGFMPVGLLYHAGISVAAACLWFAAILLIWPTGLSQSELTTEAMPEEQEGASEA